MRLIDADLFMKNFEEIAKDATDLFDAVDFALEDTPTIEERHKAYWITDGNPYYDVAKCSNCGVKSIIELEDENFTIKYCPCCGAIMEE